MDAPLWAAIEFSPDDGATWRLIARDIAQIGDSGSFSLDVTTLPGSDSALLRLPITDGMKTRAVIVGPLIIPPKPPTVRIRRPRDGARIVGLRAVEFKATASDVEDGPLRDDADVPWSSDIDGPFAPGPQLSLMAHRLTPGVHVLTATATDSGGQQGSASVTITVGGALEDVPATGPDLALSITASRPTFRPGDTETFTIDVVNVGSDASAAPATITDTLPDGLDLISAAGTDWSCASAGDGSDADAVECVYINGEIAPGEAPPGLDPRGHRRPQSVVGLWHLRQQPRDPQRGR